MTRKVRIVVVGDVHDDWSAEEDARALEFLQPDLILFTGDFGNENVELVRSIANLDMTKAVILGNHDCWNTHLFSEKRKDRVQLQLECLGEQHVGYNRLDFPLLNLSVVGGRPFSCGGDRLFRPKLLSSRYGVNNMDASAKKICEAAYGTPEGHSIVFLSHNGPEGLGTNINDICGRDWVFGGGDHGDSDLAQAISEVKQKVQIPILLVVFGHMHKELAYGKGSRKMMVIGSEDRIVYLNGAIVPRVKYLFCGQERGNEFGYHEAYLPAPNSRGSDRAFTVVDIQDGLLERIVEVWISVLENVVELKEEHILFIDGKEIIA